MKGFKFTKTIPCPVCGGTMTQRRGKHGPYFACTKYPKCKTTHGAHPNGLPMGEPADRETRRLRRELHEKLNLIWNYDKPKERAEMYRWLARNGGSKHIGGMDKKQLQALLSIFNTPLDTG